MEIISPKSFLKAHVFEKDISMASKRSKVSTDNFIIPDYSEWEHMTTINFNVNQLKSIARFYKQKISGNKEQLVSRLYNYLKYSNYSIKIQGLWRGSIRRKYNKLQGDAFINRNCVNHTDFFSLNDIKKIPYCQFFSFKDNGQVFGFNAKSLYNLLEKSNEPRNPYNRKPIDIETINNFNKFLKYGKILKENTTLTISDVTSNMSIANRINLKAQNLFYKIDTFGHITNAQWFLNLSQAGLVKFVRELIDIWEYRAQLTGSAKLLKLNINIISNGFSASIQDLSIISLQGKIR